jgi:hypothetical protein
MRLGDNAQFLKAFVGLTCNTLRTGDGLFWTRWHTIFGSGMKIAVGGWDLLYDVTGQGQDFATRIQWDQPLGDAFAGATLAAHGWSKPTVIATAPDADQCWPRLGTSMANLATIPRYTYEDIGVYCYMWWG